MNRDEFFKNRKRNVKCAACVGLTAASRICSFSKLMQNRSVLGRKKSDVSENNTFETEFHEIEKEFHKNKNYDNVVCKTLIFSLPSLIRIRATDREGNTIEVTY